jgi:TIR domain
MTSKLARLYFRRDSPDRRTEFGRAEARPIFSFHTPAKTKRRSQSHSQRNSPNASRKVWLDKFEITIGDRLLQKIDEGLHNSQYGVVILSYAFFAKGWPQRELAGLAAMEESLRRKVILPISHNLKKRRRHEVQPIARFIALPPQTEFSPAGAA